MLAVAPTLPVPPMPALELPAQTWSIASDGDNFGDNFFISRIGQPSLLGPVRDEIEFLLNALPQPTQERMVSHWEKFCHHMTELKFGTWKAKRFKGRDGSIGYYGEKGFALVFTADGLIYYIGKIDPTSIDSQDVWDANYGGWTLQKKGFTSGAEWIRF